MLSILTTHPIQYQVPLWRALAADGRVPFEVWFLTRHGAEVTRDREFGKDFAWDVDPLDGYPHRFLDVNANWDVNRHFGVRLMKPIGPLIRERGVRAVWLQGWQVHAYWQAARQARAAGAQVWLRGESNDLAPRPAWKRILRRLRLARLFRRVDHFLCIGSANRRMYERMGAPPKKLHDAPYCVDNARFAAQANELRTRKSEIRKKWNIPDNAFCLLFCGKFIPKKKPLDLVAAARRLEARGEGLEARDMGLEAGGLRLGAGGERLGVGGVHLLFAGSGELGAALRAACDVAFDAEKLTSSPSPLASNPAPPSPLASRLSPLASFPGFLNQTEIPKAYAAADCLVLPSDHGETWGLVVNEAMASGLPCIVSDACGCAEDLAEPELRYPCGDIDALTRAIAHVMKNREMLAAGSRERVKAFDLGATVDAVAGVWDRECTRMDTNGRAS